METFYYIYSESNSNDNHFQKEFVEKKTPVFENKDIDSA